MWGRFAVTSITFPCVLPHNFPCVLPHNAGLKRDCRREIFRSRAVIGQLELPGNRQMHSDRWPERRLYFPRANEAKFLVKTFGVCVGRHFHHADALIARELNSVGHQGAPDSTTPELGLNEQTVKFPANRCRWNHHRKPGEPTRNFRYAHSLFFQLRRRELDDLRMRQYSGAAIPLAWRPPQFFHTES
jgi:hypothetical protein